MALKEEWQLPTKCLGRRVLLFDTVDSTNTQAAEFGEDPEHDGLVVVADSQTAGRGQHGRSWTSKPGAGVLLSVLLFPPQALRRPALLTSWAAVSVCETIYHCTGLEARIKWPNDVFVQGRKVSGILIEQSKATVVGIGLNVHQKADEFHQAGLTEAGSLAVFTSKELDRIPITRLLIEQLDEEYDRLCQGNLDTLEGRWQKRIGLVGEQVLAECHDGTYCGQLREIAWTGLELAVEGSKTFRIPPEAVRHLKPV